MIIYGILNFLKQNWKIEKKVQDSRKSRFWFFWNFFFLNLIYRPKTAHKYDIQIHEFRQNRLKRLNFLTFWIFWKFAPIWLTCANFDLSISNFVLEYPNTRVGQYFRYMGTCLVFQVPVFPIFFFLVFKKKKGSTFN